MSEEPVQERLVQDIMVPLEEYPCIPKTLTLCGAIREMSVQIQKKGQVTLPRVALVFDESFTELLGMLRRRDIMRGLEPTFMLSGSFDYRRKLFDVETDPNILHFGLDESRALAQFIAEKIIMPARKENS